jgi:hypothetical protein
MRNKKEAFRKWQGTRRDDALKVAYKRASKEANRAVAKAKNESATRIHDELSTKEGRAQIYEIAEARLRSRQDKQSIDIIKDKEGEILTHAEKIQARWKSYFLELLNEDNAREPLEQVDSTEGSEIKVTHRGIELA